MQRGWFARAILAAVLGLGVMAGLLRADEVVMPPQTEPYIYPEAQVEVQGRRHPIRECLNKHLQNYPWFCRSDPNRPGCSGFRDECKFLFGSCRTFFGESCRR